eukprot:1997341-Alexandrium_andersonii.AAC.1
MLGVCPNRPLFPFHGQEDVVQPVGLARRAGPSGAGVARSALLECTGGPEVKFLHRGVEGLATSILDLWGVAPDGPGRAAAYPSIGIEQGNRGRAVLGGGPDELTKGRPPCINSLPGVLARRAEG